MQPTSSAYGIWQMFSPQRTPHHPFPHRRHIEIHTTLVLYTVHNPSRHVLSGLKICDIGVEEEFRGSLYTLNLR